ncbi:MAG TPA: hypothetical protein VF525_07900 [Pyrinomonadaceae bacterium]
MAGFEIDVRPTLFSLSGARGAAEERHKDEAAETQQFDKRRTMRSA